MVTVIKEVRVSDLSEQVIRFHFPVRLEGWNPEAGAKFLREYAASSTSPSVNAFAGETISEMSPEAQEEVLKTIAYDAMLRSVLLPPMTQIIGELPQIAATDFDPDVFIWAFWTSQKLVDEMRDERFAALENGVLRVRDADLLICVFSRMAGMKELVSVATAEDAEMFDEQDAYARRTARLIVFLMESFRHPHAWSDLSDAERRAIEPQCRECMRHLFMGEDIPEIEHRIPWPFAFLAWYPRHWSRPPRWALPSEHASA